jgi:hypothetical protein
MSIKGISSFLGDLPSFYIKQALSIPEHLAWIICPPTSYENTLEEALTRGMKRINEILDLPLFESNGKIDYRAAELIMRAVGFVDVRKHGMPTQRTEQLMRLTTQNLTRADARLVATQAPPKLEELEETIKSLERQLDGDSQEPIPVPERLING